jgi:hypothetical protein
MVGRPSGDWGTSQQEDGTAPPVSLNISCRHVFNRALSKTAKGAAMSGKRAADRQINNNMTEEELEGGSEEPVGTWQKADEVRARTHA